MGRAAGRDDDDGGRDDDDGGGAAASIAASTALAAGGYGMGKLVLGGVAFNKELENAEMKTAAVLQLFGKGDKTLSGRTVDVSEQFAKKLVRLHRMGTSAREVARLLGMSPNTERAYRGAIEKLHLLAGPIDALPELGELRRAVEAAMPAKPTPPPQLSGVEAWADRVRAMLEAGATPTAIYDCLRPREPDFAGRARPCSGRPRHPALPRRWRPSQWLAPRRLAAVRSRHPAWAIPRRGRSPRPAHCELENREVAHSRSTGAAVAVADSPTRCTNG
jgi:hypothetical protein